jgi:ribosomal protein S18 acetylase RimI-like enzyme
MMNPFAPFEIRSAGPQDAAALFIVHAAIAPADAGQLLDWTADMEERLESGAQAWLIALARQPTGYALIDALPGLPGVYDLSGGIVPARRRQGLGGRLLAHAARAAGPDARRFSCRVERLEDETAVFLLRRGFAVEHEECLLELTDLESLPPMPAGAPGDLITYPAERAVPEFLRLYAAAFDGLPWSQPYSRTEVVAALARPEDLLFVAVGGEPIGVVWQELLPDDRGRIEPIGIARAHQGRGHGRRLLRAVLDALRRRGARSVEIGLWRQNAAAMNLYQSLGFGEVANWYYLGCEREGVNVE